MKRYCVVYLSPGGMHNRYRCTAENKRQARRICRQAMGLSDREIVSVEEED